MIIIIDAICWIEKVFLRYPIVSGNISKNVIRKSEIQNPRISAGVLLWCGAGSNRRHKDFQSFALPTELPHHPSPRGGLQI